MVRNMLKQTICVTLIISVASSLCACGTVNDSSVISQTSESTISNIITESTDDILTTTSKISDDSTEASTVIEEVITISEEPSEDSISDQASEKGDETVIDNNISSAVEDLFIPITDMGGRYSAKAIMSYGSEILAVGDYNEKMVSASLIKLYVAAVVYENKDSVVSKESYDGETDDLLEIMISQSDNNACNTLVTRLGNGDHAVGMEKVNAFCAENGFEDTEMNRLMLDFNGLENYTSAEDCCEILKGFYDGRFKGSEEIIGFMKNQLTKTKIPAGIPDGVIVANKTGELSTVENDSAIIYSEKGDYILCVMTNDVQDTFTARNVIADVSMKLYSILCE